MSVPLKKNLSPGVKVGRWLLTERQGPNWLCVCECGTERKVNHGNLTGGVTTSCGCRAAEVTTARNTTHGNARRGRISKTYKAWKYMKDRVTTDPDYANVSICPEWANYSQFVSDMGEQPEGKTLDRVDNSKGYSPDNCRWATPLEQANNKTSNVLIEFSGVTKTLSDWSRELRINYNTLHNRLGACGWSVEKAFTTPPRHWNKQGRRFQQGI